MKKLREILKEGKPLLQKKEITTTNIDAKKANPLDKQKKLDNIEDFKDKDDD